MSCEDELETQADAETKLTSSIQPRRRGSNCADTLSILPSTNSVSNKHKEDLLKNFKIPKNTKNKSDLHSTEACSPLNSLISDSHFDGNSNAESSNQGHVPQIPHNSVAQQTNHLKRKFPEPLDDSSISIKKIPDIANTSGEESSVAPPEIKTPKSVAYWFAKPFAPWSFWSPCTSPRAHHHAHLFSPPRPVSPVTKSSQLDLPPVGPSCM